MSDHRSDAERTLSSLSVFNHEKNDIGYVERMVDEIINLSGAWVSVYLKQVHNDIDDVWDEDIQPVWNANVKIKAWFKPPDRGTERVKWGIDSQLKIDIVFSRAMLIKETRIGERLIEIGDVIEIPYNELEKAGELTEKTRPLRIRVLTTSPMGNFHYRWLYHKCTCEVVTGDFTAAPHHA